MWWEDDEIGAKMLQMQENVTVRLCNVAHSISVKSTAEKGGGGEGGGGYV